MKRLFVIILLTSLYFVCMYRFDNKYTFNAPQAANGLLVVDEDDLQNYPLRYLTHGWAFYPDVLLSPEDFKNGSPNHYMNYTMIGEHTRFDRMGTRNNPHGSGTYVLHLILPEKLTTYALELPEIFSSYRLYVDDALLLEMGNPDPDQYRSATQTQLITFDKAGGATLIIAVSDYSYVYSGMVYPPAFGSPRALIKARDIRLGLCLIISTIACLAIILSLYLGIRMKYTNAYLFSLLSFAMLGFTSYALVNTYFALPVFPWYALELSCGYVVTWLVIVLHNRICLVPQTLRCISNTFAFCFAVLILAYGLCASSATAPVMTGFSYFIWIYKLAGALYLLSTSYYSVKKYGSAHKPLFYAGVIYGTSFLWDRLLPHYEPIYSGWFLEWSSLILVLAIGYILWRDIIQAYSTSLSLTEQHRQITRQLDMQLAYSTQLAQRSEEMRRLTHDFRQHLRIIGSLATESQELKILDYLHQVTSLFTISPSTAHISFSSNPALDALLRYYYRVAQEAHIEVDFRFALLEPITLTDVDLCTILGNLLENAIEACLRQNTGPRKIHLTTKERHQRVFILIKNTYNGKITQKGNHFVSQKVADGTRIGVGIASVRQILENHHGTLEIYPNETTFTIGISLPLSSLT